MALPAILARIAAGTRGATKAFSSLGRSSKNLASNIGKLGIRMKAYSGTAGNAMSATRALWEQYEKLVPLVLENDVAQKKLERSLGSVSKALHVQAQALQQVTRFSDEQILSAQALLADYGLTDRQITQLIPTVLNLAEGLGVDAANAAGIMGDSIFTANNKLADYNIDVEGTIGSTARMESAISSVSDKFGGEAVEAADQGTGAYIRMKNAFTDLGEEIARVTTDLLAPFFNSISLGVNALSDWVAGTDRQTRAIEDQRKNVNALDKDIQPLLNRYLQLEAQTIRTVAEQKEMESLAQRIAGEIDHVTIKVGQNNEVLEINSSAAQAYIDNQHKMLEGMEGNALNEHIEDLGDLNREMDDLQALINKLGSQETGVAYKGVIVSKEEIDEIKEDLDELQAEKEGVLNKIFDFKGFGSVFFEIEELDNKLNNLRSDGDFENFINEVGNQLKKLAEFEADIPKQLLPAMQGDIDLVRKTLEDTIQAASIEFNRFREEQQNAATAASNKTVEAEKTKYQQVQDFVFQQINNIQTKRDIEIDLIKQTETNEINANKMILDLKIRSYEQELALMNMLVVADGKKTQTEINNIQLIIDKIDMAKKEMEQLGQSGDGKIEVTPIRTDQIPTEGNPLEIKGATDEPIQTATSALAAEGEEEDPIEKAGKLAGKVADVVNEISQTRLNNELARIKEKEEAEIAAVENSILSEEEKAERIAQIEDDFQAKREKARKKAEKRQKAFDIIRAGIDTALAALSAFKDTKGGLIAKSIAAGLATAFGLSQIAIIAAKKFAKGGKIPFATGGTIDGPSHTMGGVPFIAGGRLMEAEGGELIVNRGIWKRPDFVKAISNMNELTGGAGFFRSGGVVPRGAVPQSAIREPVEAPGLNNAELVAGLRGVIAEEVGTLQVVNNVVDTSSQQTTLFNQQTDGEF